MAVPILNQPAQVLFWVPTTLVYCKCEELPKMNLVLIQGFGNQTTCPRCGKGYIVNGLQAVEGGFTPVVQVVMPSPTNLVQ